jgi:hypothetical protein
MAINHEVIMQARSLRLAAIFAVFALALAARGASAQPQAEAPPPNDRAHFSGGRMVVEILAGALVGSLAGYGTYESLCDGDGCFGASLAGAGVNFAITPLAVWGVGRAMGGEGTLGMSYLGASIALTPLSMPGSPDETPSDTLNRVGVEFAISTLLLPVTSALMFEVSSHVHWKAAQEGNAALAITPVRDRRGAIDGAIAGLTVRF